METTSKLIYKTDKIVGEEHIFVTIRLDDECKNGHEDFSITGDIYRAGKPKTDRNYISGGCIHEDILKHFPEFKIFVNLHLSDFSGIPMCAIANGYYHLKTGINNTPTGSDKFKEKFCSYYRVTAKQFDKLIKAHSEAHYGMLLTQLNVFEQWKEEAKEAIYKLEQLTGKVFKSDTNGSQLDHKYRDGKLFEEEAEKIQSGYYSHSEIQKRRLLKIAEQRQEIISYSEKKIAEINRNLEVKLGLFDIGGKELEKNVIYYNHNNTISFNWSVYGNERRYTKEEAKEIFDKLNSGNYPLNINDFTVK